MGAGKEMKTLVVYDDKVHVCARMCSTCIFRPGNLMHLEAGRVDQMVRDATANEGTIPCHQTLEKRHGAICRGFFDKHKHGMLQVAERLGHVQFDPVGKATRSDAVCKEPADDNRRTKQ